MDKIGFALVMLAQLAGSAFANGEPVALFNGKDLAGWTVKCRPADAGKAYWRVEDGAIVCNAVGRKDHDYVWLVSESEYADFTLRLKFQVYQESNGNSGVQIRSRYDEKACWMNGPQVDIHPPSAIRTGLLYDETQGAQRWIHPSLARGDHKIPAAQTNPAVKLVYGSEAWNDLVIEASGTRIKTTVNGAVAADYNGEGVLNDAAHLERKVGLAGHIALQLHAKDETRIRFKAIELLPAEQPREQRARQAR